MPSNHARAKRPSAAHTIWLSPARKASPVSSHGAPDCRRAHASPVSSHDTGVALRNRVHYRAFVSASILAGAPNRAASAVRYASMVAP